MIFKLIATIIIIFVGLLHAIVKDNWDRGTCIFDLTIGCLCGCVPVAILYLVWHVLPV